MPFRQSHPPSTSDGLLGGAFVVIGFVALILIATVDVISSRWPPKPSSDDTAQDKPGSSVTPQEKDNTPDFVKDPIKEPNTLSDIKPSEITESGSLFIQPNPIDRGVQQQPQENQLSSYPLIPDLDDKDLAREEESRVEVPLEQDQGLRQEDSHTTADIHEITVPGTTDSSQEWVSLSKPEADLESVPLAVSKPDFVGPDSVPAASFVHVVDQGSSTPPKQLEEPAGELSSSTLLDDPPTELYNSTTTIGSDTSHPLSTPEPDTTQSFDNTTAGGVVVHIQTTDEEKQVPLNPKSSLDFGSVTTDLKPRTSTRSLHHSTSTNSINRRTSVEHLSASAAMKKKRGSSFIKKSGTLINKVFKNNKEASGGGNTNNIDDEDRRRLSSSFDTLDHHHSTTGLGHDSSPERKLTSPSRVSLGSIRSISGSIKKRMGRSSSNAIDTITTTTTIPAAAAAAASKVAIITSGSAAQDVEEESHHDLPEHPDSIIPSNSSQQLADDASSEPSLLKTMFKVRKPSK